MEEETTKKNNKQKVLIIIALGIALIGFASSQEALQSAATNFTLNITGQPALSDAVTIIAGNNITLTQDSTAKTIRINSSGGSGVGSESDPVAMANISSNFAAWSLDTTGGAGVNSSVCSDSPAQYSRYLGLNGSGYANFECFNDNSGTDDQTLAQVLTEGNTANMDIAMAGYNVTGSGNLALTGHEHAIEYYYPINITMNAGGTITGNHTVLQMHNDLGVTITETTGTSALTTTLNWTSPDNFETLVIYGKYSGSTGHYIDVEILTINDSTWHSLGSISSTSGNMSYSFNIPDPEHHINTNTTVRLRHVGSGNTNHYLWLDYVVLEHGGTGGNSNLGLITAHVANTSNPHQYVEAVNVDNSTRGAFQDGQVDNNGLVGYWAMDKIDGNNTIFDKSQYNNHGTWSGNATPNWTSGIGSAMSFDGVNDYVNAGNDASLDFGSNNFTISFWFKSSATGNIKIVSKYNNGGVYQGFNLFLNNGLITSSIKDTVATVIYSVSVTQYNDNKWYNAIVVFNRSSNMSLYVNDILVDSDNIVVANATISTTSPIYIGAALGFANFFNGSIDEVRIYNRALSADEVQALYWSSPLAVQALNITVSGINTTVNTHIANVSNPHSVTIAQLGTNFPNTSLINYLLTTTYGTNFPNANVTLANLLVWNNTQNGTYESQIAALQDNDTADRSYVNDTFLKLSGGTVTGKVNYNISIPIVNETQFMFEYYKNDTLVTNMDYRGLQNWYFNISGVPYGRLAFATPAGYPGFIFFNGSTGWRSDFRSTPLGIELLSSPTGVSPTSTSGVLIMRGGGFRDLTLTGTGNAIAQVDSTGKLFTNRTAGAGITLQSPDGTYSCVTVTDAHAIAVSAAACP